MGISTKKLVYDFHRKYHAVVSGKGQDHALVDIIAFLNEAQEIWFENRVFIAQTNQKVRNDIRVYKKDKVSLPCKKIDDKCCLAKYPEDLYHRLNQLSIVSKDCCPDRTKEIIPRILQSDDIHEARRNPYRKANYFFEQLNAVETVDGLIIYHDGEMQIEDIFIDYYRKPKELHAPSHEKCAEGYYMYDGRYINKDQDFEVDATYAGNHISDIAVLFASRDVSDVEGFTTQVQKILQTQTLLTGN